MKLEQLPFAGVSLLILILYVLNLYDNMFMIGILSVIIFGLYHIIRHRIFNQNLEAEYVLRTKERKLINLGLVLVGLSVIDFFQEYSIMLLVAGVMLVEEVVFKWRNKEREPAIAIQKGELLFYGLPSRKVSIKDFRKIKYNGLTNNVKIDLSSNKSFTISGSRFEDLEFRNFIKYLLSLVPEETELEPNLKAQFIHRD